MQDHETTNAFDPANLCLRVASAIVLIPLVLLAVWKGGGVYVAAVSLFMIFGLHEWVRMTFPSAPSFLKRAAYVLVFLPLGVGALGLWEEAVALVAINALVLYGLARRMDRASALMLAIGVPYLAGSGLALTATRMTDHGLLFTVYLFLVVWMTDTGAYIAGRLLGGPRLMPKVSPKKTWAGLLGGMAMAGLVGYAVAWRFEHVVEIAPWKAATLGVVMAVIAQAGDLFESWIKRRANVKDSGNLIPGHGGILDRMDGLMFAAVFFALFLSFFGKTL